MPTSTDPLPSSDSFEKPRKNAGNKSRDHVVLRAIREAERAALPPRKQTAKRRCLECGKKFESAWCGNRRCKQCADRNP